MSDPYRPEPNAKDPPVAPHLCVDCLWCDSTHLGNSGAFCAEPDLGCSYDARSVVTGKVGVSHKPCKDVRRRSLGTFALSTVPSPPECSGYVVRPRFLIRRARRKLGSIE